MFLPERERRTLLDADLQLAGIELEHAGIGDPRIALELRARLLDIEEQQRRGAGDAGSGEHFLPIHVLVAGERDRHDAKAGRVAGGLVGRHLIVAVIAGT